MSSDDDAPITVTRPSSRRAAAQKANKQMGQKRSYDEYMEETMMGEDNDDELAVSDDESWFPDERAPIIQNSSKVDSPADEPEASLSAYELNRRRNMAANQAELARLGLAGPEPSGRGRNQQAARSQQATSSGTTDAQMTMQAVKKESKQAVKKQPANAPRTVYSVKDSKKAVKKKPENREIESSSDEDSKPAHTGKRGAHKRAARKRLALTAGHQQSVDQTEVGAASASEQMVDEELFGMLCSDVDAAGSCAIHAARRLTEFLTVQDVLRAVSKLRLDIPERRVHSMVDCYDQGGKGALTFDEFRRIVAQLTR
eukprot:CAMPEP_0119342676 /NCGR_PEP_ID=MMETSP1333-20130426/105203_1 /TAXON_ID=418940 /ORGANISM="Scyphosphaera apsteinii, Strain RCC1455" /LENGTH=313 /DNA_ID=CAMNT_0007354941 /DNA_START=15 /DNA_END=956 /DNA_ORIENTATION=+